MPTFCVASMGPFSGFRPPFLGMERALPPPRYLSSYLVLQLHGRTLCPPGLTHTPPRSHPHYPGASDEMRIVHPPPCLLPPRLEKQSGVHCCGEDPCRPKRVPTAPRTPPSLTPGPPTLNGVFLVERPSGSSHCRWPSPGLPSQGRHAPPSPSPPIHHSALVTAV